MQRGLVYNPAPSLRGGGNGSRGVLRVSWCGVVEVRVQSIERRVLHSHHHHHHLHQPTNHKDSPCVSHTSPPTHLTHTAINSALFTFCSSCLTQRVLPSHPLASYQHAVHSFLLDGSLLLVQLSMSGYDLFTRPSRPPAPYPPQAHAQGPSQR